MNELAPIEFDAIIDPRPERNGFFVVAGLVDAAARMAGALVRTVQAGRRPVYWVDSGNLFNAYQIAAMARREGFPPRGTLSAIRVARPFTAYQFQEMLGRIPSPAGPAPLVVISDLMALFYDPEIQPSDLARAQREFIPKLARLKNRAIVAALLIDEDMAKPPAPFLSRVLALADGVRRDARARIAPRAAAVIG